MANLRRHRKPSGATYADPFLHSRLRLQRPGGWLHFLAPHSVFSSHRIDRGTLLLSHHLPDGEPGSFLDLGCGYGALGLDVAARFPSAQGLLVDRDLLAVEYARENARLQGAASVEVAGSLGYRDIPAGRGPFDWILSNLPARAGERVFEALILGGRARLKPGGEMRVVVIKPLGPVVRAIADRTAAECCTVVETSVHSVLGFPAEQDDRPKTGSDREFGDEVYLRDQIRLSLPQLPEKLTLERPTDLADEPHRLVHAIPLLAAHLPPSPPARVLCFRAGYGLIPALALARYEQSEVVVADRDLLGTSFAKRNCASGASRLRVIEAAGTSRPWPEAAFDLILGEMLPPLGPRAALAEMEHLRAGLVPGGEALILGLRKAWKEFLQRDSRRLGLSLVAQSGPAALYRMETAATVR